jgi:hypothetical protein
MAFDEGVNEINLYLDEVISIDEDVAEIESTLNNIMALDLNNEAEEGYQESEVEDYLNGVLSVEEDNLVEAEEEM